MTLEEDLRTTLRDRAADDAAPRPDLWAGVTDGVRRDQRRRRATVAVAAALVVGAASVTIPLLRHHQHPPNPPVVQRTDGWGPPAWPEPVFPMRPTWLPGGLGSHEVMKMGPNVLLQYEKDPSVLDVEIGPLQADWETEAEQTHASTVNGRPAEVHRTKEFDGAGKHDQYVGVRWQLADGRWVSVLSWGPRTEADVLRIATGLTTDGSIPAGKPQFTFATVPPGLTLGHRSQGITCLAPPALVNQDRPAQIGVCVTLESADDAGQEPPMEEVTVNGRHAVYYPELHQLVIDWTNAMKLVVNWDPETVPLTREDVLRFASGIS
ncbi:hypothetical protein [Actinoplanes sp. L3-i22]|uniref:hypothetical protein n=1 Tax=Actinoplanes sp. L3-i22 TaxID=2836373 RepID=UPI001C7725F3|nr:hypothetical protein [Actinoplanes sp. L3-i22]BCY10289.1 hypothetical protein L3i22_053770 [Actinoplanes sp. L3-i22]